VVIVQDQGYNPLAEESSPFKDRYVDVYVPLKSDTQMVRFLMMGKKGKPCYLPSQFKIEQTQVLNHDFAN